MPHFGNFLFMAFSVQFELYWTALDVAYLTNLSFYIFQSMEKTKSSLTSVVIQPYRIYSIWICVKQQSTMFYIRMEGTPELDAI